jgi:NitT/TauT family transport system permease protein
VNHAASGSKLRRKSALRPILFLRGHPTITRALSVAAFFLFWEYAGREANPLFMTYPSAIGRAFLEIVSNGAGSTPWQHFVNSDLAVSFLTSMTPFLIGTFISIAGGIVIGVMLGQWWFFEYTLDPFINALNAIPRVALIPLITLWAGLELGGKVAIIVSTAILPVIINTQAGVRSVRGALREIGTAFGATEGQMFFKITLPAALPYIMAGIRVAVGYAIIALVVAEFFTVVSGLGGMIVRYANVFATDKLFVAITVIALMGVFLTMLVQHIEGMVSKWRISERAHATR